MKWLHIELNSGSIRNWIILYLKIYKAQTLQLKDESFPIFNKVFNPLMPGGNKKVTHT